MKTNCFVFASKFTHKKRKVAGRAQRNLEFPQFIMAETSIPTAAPSVLDGALETPFEEASGQSASSPSPDAVDLTWVWREVRKRVFLKMAFSIAVADAMAEAVPIAMDGDNFIVGMEPRHISMAPALSAGQVRNTIENILRQAAGRAIHFEAIEGTTLDAWNEIKASRQRAQAAVIAMAERKVGEHHVEDVMNQIVSEIRQQISQVSDRILPQVRGGLVLEIAVSLADAQEMLFEEDASGSHSGRRAMSRVIDRIAHFLDVDPMLLALEVERNNRARKKHDA